MRPLLTKIPILFLCFVITNCAQTPENGSVSEAMVDSLRRDSLLRDSLALLDSLRSQVDGWEAKVLEQLKDFKVNCRVKEDSLMANGQAMPEDSAFLLLRTEARALTDSLRNGILYDNTVANEAEVRTLKHINVLITECKTPTGLQEALLLFCDYARVRQDSTPIIQ